MGPIVDLREKREDDLRYRFPAREHSSLECALREERERGSSLR